jgi:CDP-diacylglycerol--glycerol-3-phosphate 3-phosphatidyltransferase
MGLPDQLTVARILSVPVVVALYEWEFSHNEYWATAVFAVAMATDWFDGRLARRWDRTSALGSLLDPMADKVLVLSVLIVLLDHGVFPAWMVAAIVARELLVSGLRLAALERGVVMHARDLGKLKTWAQATAAPRRARPHLDQRARLCPGSSRARPAPGRRLVGGFVVEVREPGAPPWAQAREGLLHRTVESGEGFEQRLALLGGRLGDDLGLHER